MPSASIFRQLAPIICSRSGSFAHRSRCRLRVKGDSLRPCPKRPELGVERTKSAQKRTFHLQENFCLKRSEIFGPNSEKHFRMDARQQGDLRLRQIYRLDAVEQVAVLGFLGWHRCRAA